MLWGGIDVGGTFTDGVVYDGVNGLLRYAKAASTLDASTRGVLAVLDLLDASNCASR
jgi:N-methylhydantoinase A/oxoprolinase/acetone carboxylase beta subunit